MGIPLALGVGSAAGVVEGVLIVALATPERYRRTDERDRPARRRGWAFIWAFVACLGIAVSWRNSPLLMAILLAWVAPMVACCVVDVDVHRLPDVVTLPMLAGLTVCLGILAALTSRWGALGRAVGASVIVFAVFLLLGIIGRGTGMGMGDVKLSASIGLVMGYLSWVHVSSPFSRQVTAPRCTGRWRTVSGFPSRSSDVSE